LIQELKIALEIVLHLALLIAQEKHAVTTDAEEVVELARRDILVQEGVVLLGLVSVLEELLQIVEELNVVNFPVVLVRVVGYNKRVGLQQVDEEIMLMQIVLPVLILLVIVAI